MKKGEYNMRQYMDIKIKQLFEKEYNKEVSFWKTKNGAYQKEISIKDVEGYDSG